MLEVFKSSSCCKGKMSHENFLKQFIHKWINMLQFFSMFQLSHSLLFVTSVMPATTRICVMAIIIYFNLFTVFTGNSKYISVTLNADVHNILSCHVDGYPITFEWTCPTECDNTTAKTLMIPTHSSAAGSSDVFICTASVDSEWPGLI